MGARDGSFWRWSLALYRAPGVEQACLALQDDGGADVNLALFAIWVGFGRGGLDAETASTAATVSRDWRRRAVGPLRAIRRDLKRGVAGVDWAPVREAVKAVELDAERAQQNALEAMLARAPAAEGPCGRCAAEALFDRLMIETEAVARASSPAFQALLDQAQALDGAEDRL